MTPLLAELLFWAGVSHQPVVTSLAVRSGAGQGLALWLAGKHPWRERAEDTHIPHACLLRETGVQPES